MDEPVQDEGGMSASPVPPASSRRRRVLWVAVALAAVAVPAAAYRYRLAGQKSDLRFDTARVDRGRIAAKVTASGSLSAIVTVQVGSQVSGTLRRILVDFNSPVRKGELIAQIDPQLFEAAYEQATANHVAAQGNLAKAVAQAVDADRQMKRSKSLVAQQLIAQADFDTTEANADAAQAAVAAAKGAVEQAQAALHQAQINLAYTDIHSPTDGVVISRNVDVGQTVAASLQAPTLFVIAEDLRKMQVDTSVAEADIGRLKDAMPATFTVDAYPNETFRGSVRQIRSAPQSVQNVVTYDAVIDVDNGALKLKPGMTANVTFIVADEADALRLPNAALRFRPSADVLALAGIKGRERTGGAGAEARGRAGSARTVFVLTNGQPRAVTVKTGVSDGTLSEVLEGGLSEGDLVIVDASSGAPTRADAPIGGAAPGGVPRRVF
jgi:HlyD family secretion protein